MEKIDFRNNQQPAINDYNLNKLQQNVEDAIDEVAGSIVGGDTLPIYSIVDYDGDTVPTGYEQVNSYSTSEVKTGDTWIDGKPIYRKVINFTTTSSQTGRIAQDHGIQNIDNVVNVCGFVKNSNPVEFAPLPSGIALDNVSTYSFSIQLVNSTQIILFKGTGYTTVSEVYAVLEYTKTTD